MNSQSKHHKILIEDNNFRSVSNSGFGFRFVFKFSIVVFKMKHEKIISKKR